VIQISDQTGDNVIDAADVQAVLGRIAQLEQDAEAPGRCEGDERCVREATQLLTEFIETLLPTTSPQSRDLDVALSGIEVDSLSAGTLGDPIPLGSAWPTHRDTEDRIARITIDPRDYSRETRYVPRPSSQRGQEFLQNPNVHRVFGPVFLLLHEREHNTRGIEDFDRDDPAGFQRPGPIERRINSLRQALGLPQRLAYLMRRASGGRGRTSFEHGQVYHPRYDRP